MAFGSKKKTFGSKTKYTSVGLGLYDKGEFLLGKIPLDRFGEFAAIFKKAREEGTGVVFFVRENAKKKSDKSPDFWCNVDTDKKSSKAIEEDDVEEDTTDDDAF